MTEKKYIRIKENLVEVTEEVYLVYYRMKSRERFLEKKDCQHGVMYYCALDTDELLGEEMLPDLQTNVERDAVVNIMTEKLHHCLSLLDAQDSLLICELFFCGRSERNLATQYGISQPAVHKRKIKILKELKELLNK